MFFDAGHYTIKVFEADYDLYDDNIDVFVNFKSGERYGATFFTPQNLHTLLSRHAQTGENHHGQYFWCSDMVIVRDLAEQTIQEIVIHLIEKGEFEQVFERYE